MNAPEARAVTEPYVLNERNARGVVTLTLNRPQQFNALSEEMMGALQAELDTVARDDAARVVVIAARGKAFCPGHDLKQMKANPSVDYYRALFAQCAKLMLTIQRMPQPVIARVHGIATAAGCQLVAMCDLAVAASDARFAVSGINVGLFCSTPGVALSRNVGRKEAFEMLVTGDFIDAATAQARRACRSARCRGRQTGGLHRRQARPRDRDGQGPVLSPARGRDRSGVSDGRPDNGLQHDRRCRPGGRPGLHGEAQTQLVGVN